DRLKYPLGATSSTLRAKTSQPRSLLSMARLNIAKSRVRPSTCSLVRIDQTCFGRSGGFAPVSLPLVQDRRLDVIGAHSRCLAWSYSSVTEGDQHTSCVRKYRVIAHSTGSPPCGRQRGQFPAVSRIDVATDISLLRDIENDAHEDAADGMNGLVPVKPFMHQPVECSGDRRRFS